MVSLENISRQAYENIEMCIFTLRSLKWGTEVGQRSTICVCLRRPSVF